MAPRPTGTGGVIMWHHPVISSSDNPFTAVQVGMHLRKWNLHCFLRRRGYQTSLCFLSDNRYGFRNQVLKCSPAVNFWMTEAMTLTSHFQFIPGLKESCHMSNHGNSRIYLSYWILASWESFISIHFTRLFTIFIFLFPWSLKSPMGRFPGAL